MTNQHPITPPPEIVEKWLDEPEFTDGLQMFEVVTITATKLQKIATKAASWGSDQELLACGNYLEKCAAWGPEDVTEFYNYRRPKPPNLKEQALDILQYPKDFWSEDEVNTIRRALEQLDD